MSDTRARQRSAFAIVTALALLGLVGRAAPDIVAVDGGQVAGTREAGVRVFKGLPYAAAPVGELRWKPPQRIVPWTGVRDGAEFGAECPQTQYGSGSVYVRPLRTRSEDCLFLNVWTTASRSDRRPVFVWVHGGALTRGSSMSDVRDGTALAKKGIVVVSINYRLGALGYLAHPALTAESPHKSSGNYGVLDQVAALQWVQRNIAAFGGDPARVTIGGESAGSWSVNTLVATPLAKGLFVRAIGQSGGRFTRGPFLSEDREGIVSAEAVGLAAAKTLGATSLAELRALPADALLDIRGFRTQECVDGWVLPDEIRTIFARRQHNNVSVIVGSNADEMTSLGGAALVPKSQEDYRARIRGLFGDALAEFEAAYGVTGEDAIPQAILAVGRDLTFSYHMRAWARATEAAGSRAYLYLFSHVPPSPRRDELKAFHASELPYVFGALRAGDPREAGFAYTAADDRVSDAMMRYWANFIATGQPNGKGLPSWKPYSRDAEPYLEFRDPIRSGAHLFQAQLDFLEKAQNRPAAGASAR